MTMSGIELSHSGRKLRPSVMKSKNCTSAGSVESASLGSTSNSNSWIDTQISLPYPHVADEHSQHIASRLTMPRPLNKRSNAAELYSTSKKPRTAEVSDCTPIITQYQIISRNQRLSRSHLLVDSKYQTWTTTEEVVKMKPKSFTIASTTLDKLTSFQRNLKTYNALSTDLIALNQLNVDRAAGLRQNLHEYKEDSRSLADNLLAQTDGSAMPFDPDHTTIELIAPLLQGKFEQNQADHISSSYDPNAMESEYAEVTCQNELGNHLDKAYSEQTIPRSPSLILHLRKSPVPFRRTNFKMPGLKPTAYAGLAAQDKSRSLDACQYPYQSLPFLHRDGISPSHAIPKFKVLHHGDLIEDQGINVLDDQKNCLYSVNPSQVDLVSINTNPIGIPGEMAVVNDRNKVDKYARRRCEIPIEKSCSPSRFPLTEASSKGKPGQVTLTQLDGPDSCVSHYVLHSIVSDFEIDAFDEGLNDQDLLEMVSDIESKVTHNGNGLTNQDVQDKSIQKDTSFEPRNTSSCHVFPGPVSCVATSQRCRLPTSSLKRVFRFEKNDEIEMLKLPEYFTSTNKTSHVSTKSQPLVKDDFDLGEASVRLLPCSESLRNFDLSPIKPRDVSQLSQPNAIQSQKYRLDLFCSGREERAKLPSIKINSSPRHLNQQTQDSSIAILASLPSSQRSIEQNPIGPGNSIDEQSALPAETSINDTHEYQPLKPFTRPGFPCVIQDRSPIVGFTATTCLRTCFRISELLKEGRRCFSMGQDAVFELFTTITLSYREPGTTKHRFHFADICFPDRPPILKGILMNFKTNCLLESESSVFLDSNKRKNARCLGKLKKDGQSRFGWLFHVLSIRETDNEEIRWTERISSAGCLKSEVRAIGS